MDFRPCIDIHNGKVKQIVGSSLTDKNDYAKENFVSDKDASYFAKLYKDNNLFGGHIIILNHKTSSYYEEDKKQTINALKTFPNGLMVGGGINLSNAKEFINYGASHVVVTSFAFSDGNINLNNIKELVSIIGKEKLVLDLSCRFKNDGYYIMTDRWQKFTNIKINEENINFLSSFCDEFMIHAIDSEGKNSGIEENLIKELSLYSSNKITYAGGISSLEDIKKIKYISNGKMDITIGSSLDIFGGKLNFYDVIKECKE